jgi:Leucine-rich repeat (LRR) protein
MTQLEILQKFMSAHDVPESHITKAGDKIGYSYVLDQDGDILEICVLTGAARYKPFSNISFIAKFPKLEVLIFHGSDTKDLTPLKDLKNLRHLNFLSCKIKDLTPITYLPEYLNLNANLIEDIAPLIKASSRLSDVFLSDNKIKFIPDGCANDSIKKLVLSGNQNMGNLSALARLKALESLSLDWCDIQDISFLTSLPHLTFLDLRGNDIEDFSPLLRLENINTLFTESWQRNIIRNMSEKLDKATNISYNNGC